MRIIKWSKEHAPKSLQMLISDAIKFWEVKSSKFLNNSFAGVYFPKYVRDICQQLGICGWVKNSKTGTILGKMQGPRALIDQMWVIQLKTVHMKWQIIKEG